MSTLDRSKPSNIKELYELLQGSFNLDGFEVSHKQGIISVKERSNQDPSERLMTAWNQWAKEHGKTPIRSIKGKRLKGVQKILKEFPKEEDWQAILRGVQKDSWWYSVMDFDKLYRDERFYKFYEAGMDAEAGTDPLENFFAKYAKEGASCK